MLCSDKGSENSVLAACHKNADEFAETKGFRFG